MGEVNWMPGIITLAVGVVLGVIALLLLRRKNADAAPSSQMRIDDLHQEKLRLMRSLRDLQDRANKSENSDNERRQLELRAAEVFKALHEAETPVDHSDIRGVSRPCSACGHRSSASAQFCDSCGNPLPETAPARGADRPTGAGAPGPTGAGSDAATGPAGNAGAFGAFKWMAVGAFFPLVAISLYFATVERTDDMIMTGGDSDLSQTVMADPIPQAGSPGGPVMGVPPDLRPKPSAAVDRARAQVAAHPDDPDAWAALGWALVEAKGWIAVHETAQKIRKFLAIGQHVDAQKLVTDALTLDSSHIQALSFQGVMAMQRGDTTGARAAWTQALSVAGPGKGFEELIAMADSGGIARVLPEGHPETAPPATRMPPGHPGAAQSPATAGGGPKFEGRLLLAEGAVPPSGGVIFIIARHKGARGGPPAAAKRLPVGSFPIAFSISSADAMMGGTLPEEITLTARIDADGNAGTRSAEDLVAQSVDVRSGGSSIDLVLKPRP
jgi:hypothetical protein